MSAYRDYIAHASDMDVIRPLPNDERRALWAARYYGGGWHRMSEHERYAAAECAAGGNFDGESTEDMG